MEYVEVIHPERMTDSKVYGIGIVAVAVLVIGVFTLPSEETFISVPPSTPVFFQGSDHQSQIPLTTDPTEMIIHSEDNIQGINIINSTDIMIEQKGDYFIIMAPQAGRDSTGGVKYIDFWFRINDVDLPNSNVKVTLANDADATDVTISQHIISLEIGDKINLIMAVESVGQGLGIYHSHPVGEPGIPSMIFSMYKI